MVPGTGLAIILPWNVSEELTSLPWSHLTSLPCRRTRLRSPTSATLSRFCVVVVVVTVVMSVVMVVVVMLVMVMVRFVMVRSVRCTIDRLGRRGRWQDSVPRS